MKNRINIFIKVVINAALIFAGTYTFLMAEYSLLESTSPPVRMNEIQRIGNELETEAAPRIIPMLQDPSSGVRTSAAIALGRLGAEKAIEPMLKVLRNDSSRSVRIMTAQALGSFHGDEVIDELSRTAEDQDQMLAAVALRTLGRMGTEKSKEKLLSKASKIQREKVGRALIESLLGQPAFRFAEEEITQLEKIINRIDEGESDESADMVGEYRQKLEQIRKRRSMRPEKEKIKGDVGQ
ncbi:MAG: HEAT repeat domain-containing protein [Elusimicrobiota bacterium]